jgi:ribosomal protein L12E/L44/L45/RPP1/RPP2
MSATEAPAAPAEAPKGPLIEILPLGQNLARVVLTISNQASLARFQQELQTLGQHFGRIQQLQQRVQSALTTVERDALTKVGEAEVKDFAEKDAVFAKVWGFNVPAVANRQATFVNTALRLFAVISEEEAAKARSSADFKEEQLVIRGDRRLLQTAEIRGLDLVIQFDQFAKVLQARRDAVIQLTELQKRSTNDEEKTRIQTQLDQTLELLNKGNKEMAESVGYSITHNYEVEVLESKFVILLNQEEVNQIQGLMANAQQQQAAAAAPVAIEAPKLEKKADKKN